MWQSLRISHMILRVSLAFVFLWFGIDKFFHPQYWINGWVPQAVVHMATLIHVSPNALVYSVGVLELLIGISFSSNMFIDFFAGVATILILASFSSGFGEAFVRNIGLMGALLSLVFWPSPGRHRYS